MREKQPAYWLWFRVERQMFIARGQIKEDTSWCYKHCEGDFKSSPAGSNFWFEKEEDAMMFKMAKC
jgi:hypothetical protein